MDAFERIQGSLLEAIYEGDVDGGRRLAEQALALDISPGRIFSTCVEPALMHVGDQFSRLEVFLPEMMASAEVAKAIFDVLEPAMKAQQAGSLSLGKVVIGTVVGDVHDIGKNMVACLLEVSGFQVFNLGCDVSVQTLLKAAREQQADIIAMSSLLTTSLPYMKDLLNFLKETGQGKSYKVMVGGGPVTAEWASQAGADGYGKNAAEAVIVARRLLGR